MRNGQSGERGKAMTLEQPRGLRTTDGMMRVTNKTQDATNRPTLYPLRVYQNRKAMRGVPTVDDWLVRLSEWPHQHEAVWFSRRA